MLPHFGPKPHIALTLPYWIPISTKKHRNVPDWPSGESSMAQIRSWVESGRMGLHA